MLKVGIIFRHNRAMSMLLTLLLSAASPALPTGDFQTPLPPKLEKKVAVAFEGFGRSRSPHSIQDEDVILACDYPICADRHHCAATCSFKQASKPIGICAFQHIGSGLNPVEMPKRVRVAGAFHGNAAPRIADPTDIGVHLALTTL
jgi:hypothetical protein